MSGTVTDPQQNARNAVQSWMQKIGAAAENLATLDVMTITGTLVLTSASGSNDSPLTPSKLFESLKGAVNKDVTQFKVIAMTHKEIDFDAVNFVAENLTDSEKTLLASHAELVKASEDGRLAFLKMLAGLAKIAI